MIQIKKALSKDLIYTAMNQLWKLISGPLTMIFIPLFLTSQVQGYWYTFVSLSALSIFADLGFSNIVLQFSAHEFAFLSFDDNFNISGDENHIKKLASFLIFTIKWAMLMATIVFPIILIVGILIFNKNNFNINWLIPWIIYLLGSVVSFFNNTLLAFIEGCNSVSVSQKIRFTVAVVNSMILLSCLYFRFNLYALAISSFISANLIFVYFLTIFRGFLKQLISISKATKYSWKKEFLGLFWKYVISFASGYFIFQIYTPLVFHYKGPSEAGRAGISISLWTAIFSMSNVWITAITPKLNILISKKEWKKLDKLFLKNLLLTIWTFFMGSICVLIILLYFKGKIKIIDRFLDIFPMICLAIGWLLQTVINSLAVYLRAHKEEPLVVPSVFSAVYIFVLTFICVKYLPYKYLFLGFVSNYIFYFPWTIIVFYKKRRTWHNMKMLKSDLTEKNL